MAYSVQRRFDMFNIEVIGQFLSGERLFRGGSDPEHLILRRQVTAPAYSKSRETTRVEFSRSYFHRKYRSQEQLQQCQRGGLLPPTDIDDWAIARSCPLCMGLTIAQGSSDSRNGHLVKDILV